MMRRIKPLFPKRLPDIIDCSPASNFTTIQNSVLRNPNLSLKAKALLTIFRSNREGWTSYLEQIKKCTRDGLSAIRAGIHELQQNGYLLRIHCVDKKRKCRVGSFWACSEVQGHFDLLLQPILKQIDDNGWEIQGGLEKLQAKKPLIENLNIGFPDIENNTLKRLIDKKTNLEEDHKNSPRAKRDFTPFIPFATKLAEIVRSAKNINITPADIQSWARHIYHMVHTDGITRSRIYNALEWYADHIGEQYTKVIYCGESLRKKFLGLEDNMNGNGNGNGNGHRTTGDYTGGSRQSPAKTHRFHEGIKMSELYPDHLPDKVLRSGE